MYAPPKKIYVAQHLGQVRGRRRQETSTCDDCIQPSHTRGSTPQKPTFVVCLLRPASFPKICPVVMR